MQSKQRLPNLANLRTRTQIPGWLPSSQRNDVDLLSRIKRRDPEALGELYDRSGRIAFFIILRIVKNREVAEDLLAQTFVTVWNQIARWKDARIEDLRFWLVLLARNQAIEYLRSRNEPLPKALPRPTALTLPGVLQDFPRPRNNDQFAGLRHAFSTLTARESRILEMACFDGIPVGEIAVNLGETVMAIKDAVDATLEKLAKVSHES
jgi:RNA polymerase sigma-70 factor (ECF subfamily)